MKKMNRRTLGGLLDVLDATLNSVLEGKMDNKKARVIHQNIAEQRQMVNQALRMAAFLKTTKGHQVLKEVSTMRLLPDAA